jgi:sensor histidine kinase YesM
MSSTANTSLTEKNWVLQFLVSSKYRLYRHLALICLIGLVLFNGKPLFTEPALTYSRIVAITLFVLLFYTNMYVLVPRFFFKSHYAAYALSVAAIIAIISFGYLWGWSILAPYKRADANREAINLLSLSFVVIILVSASTAIKLFQRSINDSMRIHELEKTTMRSEMEQLKNQINPHFLFNMLNNANVLTQKDPLKASQVLMKLSDLLRYQLYDSARPSVLLTGEIHFLEDFLDLETIRRDKFKFLVSKEGELSGIQVAPLLLITFVENAVKHNMDPENESYIHLYFDVRNEEFHFKCINSKPRIEVKQNRPGGLGLANVKRRLDLIYPGKHALQTDDDTDAYIVNLTIKL